MRVFYLGILVLLAAFAIAQQTQPGNPTEPSAPPATTGGTHVTPAPAPPAGDTTTPTTGWRTVQDKVGLCQWAVPGGWYAIEPGNETLIQFDKGRAAATLHHNPMKSWDQFREHIKENYRPTKIMEDTADRLWFRYKKGQDGTHVYVARPAGTEACAAQIDVTDQADEKELAPVIERLASSVAPVRHATATK